MEAALGTSPSVVGNVEPFLFNLGKAFFPPHFPFARPHD